MAADNEQELLQLVSETEEALGTAPRSLAHSHGLLHRAVYCWVFRAGDGALLLQRRSPLKRVGGGQLDLSVAEHLQVGETYAQGAARGLAEELGIRGPLRLRGPLAPTHRRELHQGDFHDVELVQSFRLDGYSGPIELDSSEVAEVKWVPLGELRRHAEQHPEDYTQWFLEEAASLGWFAPEPQREEGRAGVAGAMAAR